MNQTLPVINICGLCGDLMCNNDLAAFRDGYELETGGTYPRLNRSHFCMICAEECSDA